jgi:hypothetical protein
MWMRHMLVKNLPDGYISQPDETFWERLLRRFKHSKIFSHQRKVKLEDELFDGHDFSLCAQSRHMFGIFNMTYQDVIYEIQRILSQQQPNTRLVNFKVLSEPDWLVGAGKVNSQGQAPMRRSGFALDSQALVTSSMTNPIMLNFIFSYVAIDLGLPTKRQQFWIDIDGSLAEFGSKGNLLSRIYGAP